MPIRAIVATAAILACAIPAAAQTSSHAGDAIPLSYAHVALNSADPTATTSRRLTYRGGLIIQSPDNRFGGLSGLLVSKDGSEMVAVSDSGYWFSAQLDYRDGNLDGVSRAYLAPLLDAEGKSVADSKRRGDAESLARLPDGRLIVGFERNHRVEAYDFDATGMISLPTPVPISPDLKNAVNNKGLEAIETLPDGSLIALTEGSYDAQGYIKGWRVSGNASTPVALRRSPPFDLTDTALLPSGDLLTLERRFSLIGGVGAQLRLIESASLNGNGPLDGDIIYRSTAGHTIDNMEGLAVRTAADGATLLYVVSDDNFNPLQRTLLLMFELMPPADQDPADQDPADQDNASAD